MHSIAASEGHGAGSAQWPSVTEECSTRELAPGDVGPRGQSSTEMPAQLGPR